MRRAVLCLWLCACDSSVSPQIQAEQGRDLVIAAHRGNVGEVRRLLDLGVDINARCGPAPTETFQGENGGWPVASAKWTALIAAADSSRTPPTPDGHLEVVRLLIRRKADVNLHDGYGGTALARAVTKSRWHKESLPIALALIEAGAEVNTRTGIYIDGPGDITPLHEAMGQPVLAKALLDRGANPDARTTDGDTPLHWAVRDKDIACVQLLIAAKADLHVRNESGRTALSWASSRLNLKASVEKDNQLDAEARKRLLKRIEERAEPPGELEKLLRAAGATD